jgi:MFS family permease
MPASYAILRSRDFRLLLTTQGFVTMANQAQAVVVGWQVYSLTKDPLMLGLIGLTEAIPAILAALFAGHFVDVSRPHFIYKVCLGALVLNTLFLLLIGGGLVNVPGGDILPYLFGAVFISGLARSFTMPAAFALLGQIIPRESMSAAAGWRSSILQFSFVTGPAVAGLLYGGYGATVAWLMPCSLMAIAFIALCALHTNTRRFKNPPRSEGTIASIKAGWKFIWGNQLLLGVMALDMFAVLFGGATAMLPAFADQVLHIGSEGLGLLRASPAIGSILMALVLALWPLPYIRPRWLLYVVAAYGFCMIGFGLSTHFAVAALFLVLSGVFDSVSVVIRSTIAQWLTPDTMRGRVSSVNSMFIVSSNEIGAFESGVAARAMGLVPSIIFGGCATLAVVVAAAYLAPKLRHGIVHAHSHETKA